MLLNVCLLECVKKSAREGDKVQVCVKGLRKVWEEKSPTHS